MKGFLVLIAILVSTSFAHSLTIVNVYDGKIAECPSRENSNLLHAVKNITVYAQNNYLVVQASKCINGKWVINYDVDFNEYIAFDTGEKVTEHYYDFVVHLSNADISKYQNIDVRTFVDTSVYKIPLEALKAIDKDVVELNVTASRDTLTSGGFSMTDDVRWGSFRIFLNK